jgi:uridine kinase
VTYRPYDWDLNELSARRVTVDSASVVVVEGLVVARPELETLIDITVLVTTCPSVRRKRRAVRAEASEEWLQRWDAETWYFDRLRPANQFDVSVEDPAEA